jgi:hypothetical protein
MTATGSEVGQKSDLLLTMIDSHPEWAAKRREHGEKGVKAPPATLIQWRVVSELAITSSLLVFLLSAHALQQSRLKRPLGPVLQDQLLT